MNAGRLVVAAHWIVPVEGPVLSPGFVCLRDGLIETVASGPPPDDMGPVEDFGRAAVLPGFVNAHTHLGCAFLQGEADDSGFLDWLLGDVAPRVISTVREDPARVETAALAAARELARGGVTTVADSFFHPAGLRALETVGLRGRFHREVFGSMATDLARYVADETAALRAAAAEPRGALVELGVAPHSLYTCPRDVLVAVDALASTLGLHQTIHIDESAEEHEFFTGRSGPMHARFGAGREDRYDLGATPVGVLAELGMLRPDVLLVHAVRITPEDVAAIASAGAPVVHCPGSNQRLAVGIAPVRELLDAGVEVALGTDSHASNGKLDMFEEMRLAILGQRTRSGSAAALDAATALRMGTIGGARAMGLGDVTGSLAPGKAADLMVVDLGGCANARVEDPISAVVWSSTPADVVATWVSGHRVDGRSAS